MGIKTQHITFKGSSAIRNSDDIYPETIQFFKQFQISKQGAYVVDIPRTPFKAKVTVAREGAIFDIMKNDDIAYTNFCCFHDQYYHEIMNLIKGMTGQLDTRQIIREPSMHLFLYTIPVNPFILSPQEGAIAGEIEFYIYYSLYLANHDK